MKKITFKLLLIIAGSFLLTACESVKEDAEDTPIGSVVSGKSRDGEQYVEKVRERNKSIKHDTWRPESTDGF